MPRRVTHWFVTIEYSRLQPPRQPWETQSYEKRYGVMNAVIREHPALWVATVNDEYKDHMITVLFYDGISADDVGGEYSMHHIVESSENNFRAALKEC